MKTMKKYNINNFIAQYVTNLENIMSVRNGIKDGEYRVDTLHQI